jgi:hypothetical protein
MLSRIFPKAFDNAYRGHWLAIWIFVPVMLVKAIQGANSILMTRRVMTTADGIPLDTFNAAGAETAVAMFALLGFYLLMLPLQSVAVLIRYRAMIPFMYLLLLIQQTGSRLILLAQPVVRSSAMPIGVSINLAILALTIIGFVLSLLNSGSRGNPA